MKIIITFLSMLAFAFPSVGQELQVGNSWPTSLNAGTEGSIIFVGPNKRFLENNNRIFWDRNVETFRIGANSLVNANAALEIFRNANSGIYVSLYNTSTSNGAFAAYGIGNEAQFRHYPTTYSGSGAHVANTTVVENNLAGGVNVVAGHASGQLGIYTGGFGTSNKRIGVWNDSVKIMGPLELSTPQIGNPTTNNSVIFWRFKSSSLGNMEAWDDYVMGASQINGAGAAPNNFVFFQGLNLTNNGARSNSSRPSIYQQYEQQFEVTGFGNVTEWIVGHTNANGNAIRPIYWIRSWLQRKSLFWLTSSLFLFSDDSTGRDMLSVSPAGISLYDPSPASFNNSFTFEAPSGTTPAPFMLRKRTNDSLAHFQVVSSDASNNIFLGDASNNPYVAIQSPKFMLPANGVTSFGNFTNSKALHFTGEEVSAWFGLNAGAAANGNTAYNVGIGYLALSQVTGSVTGNVAIGAEAGSAVQTGYGNVLIGRNAFGRAGTFNEAFKNVVIGDSCGRNFNLVIMSNQLLVHNSPSTQLLLRGKFSDAGANMLGINLNDTEPRTTLDVNGSAAYKFRLSTDANFTVAADDKTFALIEITAGRNCVMPTPIDSRELTIHNRNTSGNNWTFTGATVKDEAGSNITTLANSKIYTCYADGTNWYCK